jgi:hypothetical protein
MADLTTNPNRRYPALPDPGDDLKSHSEFLRALKAALQTHERRDRDILNSFVRLGELVDLGIVKVQGTKIVPQTGFAAALAGGDGGSVDAEFVEDTVGALITNSSEISWTYNDTVPSLSAALVNGGVAFAHLQNADALSVLGRSANSSGVMDEIAAGANDRVLRRTSDALNFGQLTAGMFPNTVVPDAALSSNVPLKDANNAYTPAGGVAQVAIFNSTNAGGPYVTFSRSGTPFGDVGNGSQMGVGFTVDSLALAGRPGQAIEFGAGGATSPHLRIAADGTTTFSGSAANIASFSSSAANGPYTAYRRNATAFGFAGDGAQMGSGFTANSMAMTSTSTHPLELGTADTMRIRIAADGATTLTSTQPRLLFNETDADTNEKLWVITTSGGDWFLDTRTDADGSGATAVTITRTGTTIGTITLNGATTINNGLTSTQGFTSATAAGAVLASSSPTLLLNQTTGAANNRIWTIHAVSEQLTIGGAWNDDVGAVGPAITIDRTGTTIDSIVLTATSISLVSLVNAADDSAAATAGVPVNGLYRNGSVVQIRVS